jgi:oxygen-independent coproporphyrinogen-3 oxidase
MSARARFVKKIEKGIAMPGPTATEVFAAQVPRYTSYPTVPQFGSGIGAAAYRDWLGALPEGMPLSLYVHIPFCDTLCWFCARNTTVVNNYAPVREYCALLLSELERIADALGGRHPLTHIHWGGGSPTILERADMLRLNEAIRARFSVAADAEVAMEIDPRGFDETLCRTLADCGVTRASIGLQDCDPKVQRAINRIQPDEVVGNAFYLLREHGISNLNLDLVYGLPHQSRASFSRNLDLALWLDPDRIAIFGYAHVPGFKKHQLLIDEASLPGIQARLALADQAARVLCGHGYEAIGIDHFALPADSLARAARNRTMRRNFQGYTADRAPALIGLGASAIGGLPQGYVQNASTVPAYRAALEAGRLPAAKGLRLSPEDRLRGEVIQEIMCFLSADVGAICENHGYPASHLDQALESLRPLERSGYLAIRRHEIVIDPDYRQAARLAAAGFDAYLNKAEARHAVTA